MAAIHNGRLTLDAVLRIEKAEPVAAHVNRTLLDILLDDDPQGSVFDHEDKTTWKAFRDRLRLKRPDAASTSEAESTQPGGRSLEVALAEERALVRVSLMDLLEEREREREKEGSNGGRVEKGQEQEQSSCCCVCMVRNKGAAFIPCGHTFCRLCSKELLATRAHCPLCNASILEILHIF